jgi:hypothetical protein
MSIERGPSFTPLPGENKPEVKKEKPLAKPSPYMAPEMYEAATEGEVVEQKDFIGWGDKKLRVGDKALVLRSSGEVESDWTLKSFGNKFAVVEKVDVKDGAVLRKVVPVDELGSWQTILEEQKEPYAGLDEGYGGKKGRIDARTPEGRAELLKIQEKMVKGFGIDTSKPGWEAEVERKIREITGV